jgi:UDP-2,3-diacylglucosamine pyrophosphatase LpxH
MNPMRYLVTSDLHLGNRFSNCRLFAEMVQRLDDSVTLILGGDIIDAPGKPLAAEHQNAIEAIRIRAETSDVIWIEGNHDEGFHPLISAGIHYQTSHTIEDRVFITHGDSFDEVMPRNRIFVQLFNFFHKLRIYLGASPVHVADYAKRFKYLYNFLRRKVMLCAVDHGNRHDFEAVVCGHVHFAEDTICEGVRYINLGAWTESDCYCLLVEDGSMELIPAEKAMLNTSWFPV